MPFDTHTGLKAYAVVAPGASPALFLDLSRATDYAAKHHGQLVHLEPAAWSRDSLETFSGDEPLAVQEAKAARNSVRMALANLAT